jgi:hypothetical protein
MIQSKVPPTILTPDPGAQAGWFLDNPFALAGPDPAQNGKYRSGIVLDVTDPEKDGVLAGGYHAVFNGIVVSVPGLWVFAGGVR